MKEFSQWAKDLADELSESEKPGLKGEIEKLLRPLPKEERDRLVNGKFEPSIFDDFQIYGVCATLNGERVDPKDLY